METMRAAIDVDINALYVVDESGRNLNNVDVPTAVAWLQAQQYSTVLVECASPQVYSGQVRHGQIAWVIWNTWAVAAIAAQIPHVYVAPSSVWTKGHPAKVRHALAACRQKNHDLRECEAMLFFHAADSSRWLSLSEYMNQVAASCRKKSST